MKHPLSRVTEIIEQEKCKGTATLWLEWALGFRPGVRRYDRYVKPRFNPLTGKVE